MQVRINRRPCDLVHRAKNHLIRMCVSRLNQENGIPFSMKLEEETNPGIRALQRASRIAEEYGISDMTLEEINAEIVEARK